MKSHMKEKVEVPDSIHNPNVVVTFTFGSGQTDPSKFPLPALFVWRRGFGSSSSGLLSHFRCHNSVRALPSGTLHIPILIWYPALTQLFQEEGQSSSTSSCHSNRPRTRIHHQPVIYNYTPPPQSSTCFFISHAFSSDIFKFQLQVSICQCVIPYHFTHSINN